jgi:hypothetical protein
MSLAYYPLRLADMSVRDIAVHRGLALLVHPVLLRHGSELIRCPVAIELSQAFLFLTNQLTPP